MSRSRDYCFTINNPTEDDYHNVHTLSMDDAVKYIIVGKEKGDEGTPHYQGYVYFKEAKTFTSVKKKLPRAHIEETRGTPHDNEVYCSKQGDVIIQSGVCPKQGARSDIEKIREMLDEGENMRSVTKKARSLQSIKMAEVYLKFHEEARTWKPEVRWYHGSTGSGKTKSAREWLEDDIYTCLDTIKWFEGYDAHNCLLIDDIRKDFCKFHQLLKLLDRYEYRVEVKGGSRQMLAKKIAITSPMHPKYMYQNREDVNQLLRRIDEIILIGEEVRPHEEVDLIDS